MYRVGTVLSAGEAETQVWGHLLLAGAPSCAGSSPVHLELAGSLDVWVFTPPAEEEAPPALSSTAGAGG